MKKSFTIFILLLLISAFFVLSLSSCGTDKPESVVNNAIKNTSKLTEFEAKMDMAINVQASDEDMNIPVSILMKVKDGNKKHPLVYSYMSTEMFGEKMESEAFMDDKFVYVLSGGEGYKMKVEDAEGEYDYSDQLKENLKKLPKNLLKDTELIQENNGSYKIAVKIPENVFDELYGELLDDISEISLGEVFDSLDISDCMINLVIKDNFVTSYTLSYNMSNTTENETVSAAVSVAYEIVNPGKSVSITPPQGYESFEEIGW